MARSTLQLNIFCMESEAYKICEGWATGEGNAAFPTNARSRNGRLVHKQLIQTGCESDVFVGSSLVDMYAKCGDIEDAWRVFNKMPSRNVVTWTSMIF
ncbi:unnamed protein product [Sphagnum jensenii]|uniref:Pentatricopeptide repeat-containing protein n=1 Tax=Sphagnum jensenii TaxID=128206 RepID=A0ABP0VR48_9BRYO